MKDTERKINLIRMKVKYRIKINTENKAEEKIGKKNFKKAVK
jgi:hypothetical protein